MSKSVKEMEKQTGERGFGKNEPPKVMIGIPSNRDLKKEFVAQLLRLGQKVGINNLFMMQNAMINQCRDALVQVAVQKGFDYIMWLDDDMIVPDDVIERLMAHNKDIVSGLYFGRKNFRPLLFDITPEDDENGDVVYSIKNHTDYPQSGLFLVDGVGFGCVLTKVEALKKIWNCPDEGIGKTCFDFIGGVGEDLSFGIRCQRLGIQTWVDPTVKCGHLSEFVVTEEHWKAVKEQELAKEKQG